MSVPMKGFINIYRCGWFHREGKPGNIDRHAGDIYLDEDEALRNIDPPSHYICTIPVEWVDVENVAVNPPDSVPVSLSASRKAHAAKYAEPQLEAA